MIFNDFNLFFLFIQKTADNINVMTSLIVALDLGTTHLRGIEAEVRNGKPPKIKKIHSIPLDSDIISAGEIKNVEGLAKGIKKLFDEAKFTSKFVVSMAGGDAAETRVMETPWSPDADYKKLLPHYIREDSVLMSGSDDEDKYYFDAHTLQDFFKASDNEINEYNPAPKLTRTKRVLVVAIKREFTDRFVEAVETAGLRPYSLDLMPLALIRAQANATDIPVNASVISVEIGGDITTIVIHKNLQPIYTDTATFFGGLRITNEIAQTLGVTLAEAELLKISFSVPAEARGSLKTFNYYEGGRTEEVSYSKFSNAQKETAAMIVSREVSNIVTHVGDIIEDAFSTTPDTPFRIVLSGGGAGLHSLLPRLQTELGIPTQIIQPFAGFEKSIPNEYIINQHIYAAIYGILVGQNEIK